MSLMETFGETFGVVFGILMDCVAVVAVVMTAFFVFDVIVHLLAGIYEGLTGENVFKKKLNEHE